MRILPVIALEREAQGVFERAGVAVLYTGLGKVNAAMTLARRLAVGELPELVINFGTVGSPTLPTHSVVACHAFVQRDMDVTGLGFAHGETPFEDVPARLEVEARLPWLPQVVCGTGDRFETGPPLVPCDVVDMEAYALAKVCRVAGVPFACVKVVTDGADHAAAGDWEANLPRAAAHFLDAYRRLSAP
jgi:adenosylhomocysteine nucleosidase